MKISKISSLIFCANPAFYAFSWNLEETLGTGCSRFASPLKGNSRFRRFPTQCVRFTNECLSARQMYEITEDWLQLWIRYLTILLLHHHQLLFLHVRQSNKRIVVRLSQVLVRRVLASESGRGTRRRRRGDLCAETADVKHGQWLLRLNAVERRSDVVRPRVCDALNLLLRVTTSVRRLERHTTQLHLTNVPASYATTGDWVSAIQKQVQLEGHSVERMYLRQRCSDGSRWIKPF